MTLLGGLSQVEKADNEIQKIVNGVIYIFYVHIFFFESLELLSNMKIHLNVYFIPIFIHECSKKEIVSVRDNIYVSSILMMVLFLL